MRNSCKHGDSLGLARDGGLLLVAQPDRGCNPLRIVMKKPQRLLTFLEGYSLHLAIRRDDKRVIMCQVDAVPTVYYFERYPFGCTAGGV